MLKRLKVYEAIGSVEELKELIKEKEFELTINRTLEEELSYYKDLGIVEELKTLKDIDEDLIQTISTK